MKKPPPIEGGSSGSVKAAEPLIPEIGGQGFPARRTNLPRRLSRNAFVVRCARVETPREPLTHFSRVHVDLFGKLANCEHVIYPSERR